MYFFQVLQGDHIDVILKHASGIMSVKRVRIVQAHNHPKSQKVTVYLRVWRAAVDIPVIKGNFESNK